MLGFVVGALSLVGLVKVIRGPRGFHRRCHRERHQRWGRSRHGSPRWLHHLFWRLDTSAGQEREIRSAIREFVDEMRGLRGEFRSAGATVGESFRDEFDEARLDALFDAQDEKIAQVRSKLKETLGRIHQALDEPQRDELAAWLERWGGRGGFAGWGPYR
ncbi:MAG: periplasmic heavy metal sensor [Myxococcota bacterium]